MISLKADCIGVMTVNSFSVAKGGKEKHRLFPFPAGWMMRVFLAWMTALIASSCQFLNVVKPKFFTSNPSSCIDLSSVNGMRK